MKLHTHYIKGKTSYNDGHDHNYSGETSASPDRPGHTHFIKGKTSLSDRHVHYYLLATGPEVDAHEGHKHHYKGLTRYADGHTHSMEGNTSTFKEHSY